MNDREALIDKVTDCILEADKTVVLTGAGISVESGIAPFRGKDGVWEKYDPMEYGHISSFKNNPEKCWVMLREMANEITKARPNAAHYSLAELEEMGMVDYVITQNVDNLHQDAGSRNVVEFHGNFRFLKCLNCGKKRKIDDFDFSDNVPRCRCGHIFKPDVIMFGESLPVDAYQKGVDEAESCDLMLIVGTSAVVYPAANIPFTAKRNDAKIVDINLEETNISRLLSDYTLKAKAGEVLPKIVEKVKEKNS
ncbi:MAG: NAD-dependent deacylase [Candidatus Thermoplasmatota archaeon]